MPHMTISCRKCGSVLEPSDKYCFNCGEQSRVLDQVPDPGKLYCRQCGAFITAQDKFCGSCGTAASQTQSMSTPPASHNKRSHRVATSIGYVLLSFGIILIAAGFLIANLPVQWNDFGLLPILVGLSFLAVNVLVVGPYLWAKPVPVKRHGIILFFVSLFLFAVGIGLLKLTTFVFG